MKIINFVNNVLGMIMHEDNSLNASIDALNHIKLTIPKQKFGTTEHIFKSFIFSRNVPMLEFKVASANGVYIRIYRSKIEYKNGIITKINPNAIAVYHRGRWPGETQPRYELIGYISEKTEQKLERHLQAFNQLKNKSQGYRSTPTLGEFLPEFEKILYLKNPATVDRTINLIKSKFDHLLTYPIDEIKGDQLINFVNSHRRNRTSVEIQNEESPYDGKRMGKGV